MDVKKLLKAASLVKEKNPELSNEILRIAQDLGQVGNLMDASLPNENIKNYAKPASERRTHKVTFSVEVPSAWGELDIMNQLMPVLQQISNQDPDINIKGYQFSQN